MTEKIEVAMTIRAGAERLRRIAADEANPERAREMLRHAAEMDEHATEIERAFAKTPPEPPSSGKRQQKPKDNAKR